MPNRRNLRDRSTLKEPQRYKDCTNFVEDEFQAARMSINEFACMSQEFLLDVNDPKSYQEAVNSESNSKWMKAMDQEILSHQENGTWKIVDLPKGAKCIPCKWVFKTKLNPDGTVDKYKARVVVKGFHQREGVEFNDT